MRVNRTIHIHNVITLVKCLFKSFRGKNKKKQLQTCSHKLYLLDPVPMVHCHENQTQDNNQSQAPIHILFK